MKIKQAVFLAIGVAALVLAVLPADAARERKRIAGGDGEQGEADYKAHELLTRGVELLKQKQEDRGVKLIESVIRSYPDSFVRFNAHIAMGDYHQDKNGYNVAVKQFLAAAESESDEITAEALYKAGICYYHLNLHDKAFVTLRKVTTDYPWSVYANEAYYYIGLCHFKLERWSRAFEALELVGTSVPSGASREVRAEAGQRFFAKVDDGDLQVVKELGKVADVQLTVQSGDRETVTLAQLGKQGNLFLGSVMTQPGAAVTNDGTLQTIGGDTVEVSYVDEKTESGKANLTRVATARFVSSATIGFVDGAYRDYRKGIFAGQDAFIRVRDLDRDTSGQPDRITVKVRVQYKEKREEDIEKTGIVFEEEELVKVRSEGEVVLTETGPHTGVFTGVLPVALAADDQRDDANDAVWAMRGDEAVLLYTDDEYIGGDDPRNLEYSARVVVGDIQDVRVEHREVATLDLKARKDLIEAKILLKLAQIFKDVGLNEKAYAQADEALERANAVVSTSLQASLDRNTVEQAFSAKWNLLIVKDDLSGAIRACSDLINLFPDSALVDQALMKIAVAKIASGREADIADATRILAGIQQLPKSDLKAEAQYMMAEIAETSAIEEAKESAKAGKSVEAKPNLSQAMTLYKQCADRYPESLMAGQALNKVCNYYINVTKDYARAVELLELIFQDYPDAGFLDEMLFKWVVVAYRTDQYQVASEKCMQLLSEYPDSPSAKKALQYQENIEKKLRK